MMKKIAVLVLFGCTAGWAGNLYTDTFMSRSGIVHPPIETGIPNLLSSSSLMKKKSILTTSLYFRGGAMSNASDQAFQQILDTIKDMGSASCYISVIGHTSGYTSDHDNISLNVWSAFWHNIRHQKISRDRLAASVNERILAVYDRLKANGVNPSKIYTENRMGRDPVSTEATSRGRTLNQRITVTLYR